MPLVLELSGKSLGTEVASPAQPDALFLHTRPVPSDWTRDLLKVCPRYQNTSWFKIVWEPGEEHDPIQRFGIWQMRSEAETKKLILRDYPGVTGFHEEHPRANAKWDAKSGCYRKTAGPLKGRLAKTDKLTWELYHETGCYGVRFWCIQGEHGGHRYNLSHIERQILRLGSNFKLRDVPLFGELPYAPFDDRVVQHFAHIEHVAMARKVCKYAAAHLAQLDQDEHREAEQARLMLFNWMGNQFGELYDEFRPFIKQQLRQIVTPVGAKPEHTDGDEVRERFIYDQ